MQEKRLSIAPSPGWILLPLRLFLGITFIYAGIQKLADPQFFDPQKAGYIGKQLAGYATASPLKDFLLHVAVPHAQFFGFLVAFGEVAMGAGALLGLLMRPAAFFGALLSLVFFLSATWRVYPYFFGSDIVFVFAWLTLLLNGPSHTGLPTIDESLFAPVLRTANSQQRSPALTRLAMLIIGIRPLAEPVTPARNTPQHQGPRRATIQQTRSTRRGFLMGLVTGGIGAFGLAAVAMAARILNTQTQAASPITQQPTAIATQPPTPSQGDDGNQATPTPASTDAPAGNKIAQVNAVPNNSSVPFTINSSGEAGMLIRLPSGKFVAYDLRCTHAGCQVDYDPQQHLLVCPCHGAEFDPAQQANPVMGPAETPLTPVTIHIDSTTGTITQV
ncbi:TQO small subunit DoxD [Dictyobacter formicarum]|uniref:Rieske domain-containing protein n=1 Tax=Dictyobacter formicarum TaxID=2778368 RepID=A0ABQ3VES8_9CHLR|nr:TQO small subunit DoxD [Dictyobacter formicarum]GHO84672.1 hypothetical protein KSZ_26780 [Dictyobacter formicarum]